MPDVEVACRRRIAAEPAHAFALALDTDTFPRLFRGRGPIPAVTRVERLDTGPLRVGSRRRVHSADGNSIEETVLELVPPLRHRYRVGGFAPPFGWWVTGAEADWEWTPTEGGVEVCWRYRFETRGAVSRAIVGLVARRFFAGAMRDCLAALARLAAAAPPATAPVA